MWFSPATDLLLLLSVSGRWDQIDPAKVPGTADMWPPINVHQLQSFLGMIYLIQPLMPQMLHCILPVKELLKKNDTLYPQSNRYKKHYIRTLKNALIKAKVVSIPLHCTASSLRPNLCQAVCSWNPTKPDNRYLSIPETAIYHWLHEPSSYLIMNNSGTVIQRNQDVEAIWLQYHTRAVCQGSYEAPPPASFVSATEMPAAAGYSGMDQKDRYASVVTLPGIL